jgi:hypothetical protein
MQSVRNTVPQHSAPTYGPLVPTCAAYGIGRTKAFELAASGTIETFTIGSKRLVIIESLRTLPQRLKAQGGAE